MRRGGRCIGFRRAAVRTGDRRQCSLLFSPLRCIRRDDRLKAVWAFIHTSACGVWGFVRKYPFHVVSAVVVVIAANQLLGYVEKKAEREITVYVGPPGSSSYQMRERIASAIQGISTTPGSSGC